MGAERRLSQRIGETGLRAGRSAAAHQRIEGIAILSQDFDRLAANEGGAAAHGEGARCPCEGPAVLWVLLRCGRFPPRSAS